ncbi:hypothetical protein MSG28_013289 [Choristoneura fumiferana]|uniref:Uncharacterized protein n=1 Tax=Choristoneura fumiferana TaxID=7141 RepID=A0ACC0KT22_CHOFU|nr:hypothetical protein MSG28_013289 [Choristoneura fumiferana]
MLAAALFRRRYTAVVQNARKTTTARVASCAVATDATPCRAPSLSATGKAPAAINTRPAAACTATTRSAARRRCASKTPPPSG